MRVQVYMHHLFGPSDFLAGEGAEHRGSKSHAALPAPYYTNIPADRFTPKGTRCVQAPAGPWLVLRHLAALS